MSNIRPENCANCGSLALGKSFSDHAAFMASLGLFSARFCCSQCRSKYYAARPIRRILRKFCIFFLLFILAGGLIILSLADKKVGQEDKRLKDATDVFNSGKSGDQAAIQQSQPPVDPSQSVLPKQTFYSVTNIAQHDTLNVRSGPGVSNDLVARLPNNFSGIRILSEPILNGTTEWVQIVFDNRTGWVVKSYLKPE
jgi:hypothetical protein